MVVGAADVGVVVGRGRVVPGASPLAVLGGVDALDVVPESRSSTKNDRGGGQHCRKRQGGDAALPSGIHESRRGDSNSWPAHYE